MVKNKRNRKSLRKALKKEVHLPIHLPDNKVGKALSKNRRLPMAKYVSESFTELKRVTWPSRRESIKLTFAVIVFTAVFTIFMSLADFGIGGVVERVLL